MEIITPPDAPATPPLLEPEERLKLWRRFKGIWESRVPDPVEDLRNIRNEWDRDVPPGR